MLRVSNLSKSYGGAEVLRSLSFVVNAGERLAVVGPNGAGKSTLLRILAGLEPPDAGHALRSPPALAVGYLPQGYAGSPDLSVGDAFPELARPEDLEGEVARLAGRLAAHPEDQRLLDAYQAALDELGAAAGQAAGSAEAALRAWGLAALDPARPVASLSGGEQTRLGLARLQARGPDLVLLDEPTNHLDMVGIEQLEEWLAAFRGGVVLVTHDRALLSAVATAILELEPRTGAWRLYRSGYIDYLEAKGREAEERRSAYGRQERQVRRTREQVRRLKQRALRTERETTHFHYRKRAARVARQARIAERRLERFLESAERVEKPGREERIRPELAAGPRSGDDVLSVTGLTLEAGGRTLVRDAGFSLRYGEHVALLGANGSGKTTLLRAVLGQAAPVSGEVRLGAGVRPGLLSQDHGDLDPARTPVETLRPLAVMEEAELRRFLHHYLLAVDDVVTPVSLLSYGQRARLALARLVLQGVNLLLLDEPTNHLDIPSREAFEGALDGFQGTVLVVSHDRYFLERFASRVLVLEDGALWEEQPRI